MTIDKKEIIDEIISIEPGLENDREKMEEILEDFILIKPNIEISSNFKENLKNKLLLKIKNDWIIYKKDKYNSLKNIISFILWWILTYSMVWMLWMNLGLFNFSWIEDNNIIKLNEKDITQTIWNTSWINNDSETNILVWSDKIESSVVVSNNDSETNISVWNDKIESNVVVSNNIWEPSANISNINEWMNVSIIEPNIWNSWVESTITPKTMFSELRLYFKKIGLNKEQIAKIIKIIKEYY